MPEPTKIPRPFADSGDKNSIPDSSGSIGFASWQEGFPAITSEPFASGGVAPKRADFNGVFNALSAAVVWAQQGGVYAYDATTDYEVGNVVLYNGNLYKCLAANGPSSAVKAPSDTTVWDAIATASSFLPLSGGTLTGVLKTSVQTIMPITSDAIQGVDNTGRVSVCGGKQYLQGARALLYGIQNTSNPGEFALECTDGNIIKTLRGKADGTLTWGGDDIGVISAKNYGSSSGYTYFKSGLQICWGNNTNPSTASTGNAVTFPRAFKTVPSVFVTRRSISTNTTPVSWMWPRETIDTTGMNVYVPEFAGFYWLAIGQGAD